MIRARGRGQVDARRRCCLQAHQQEEHGAMEEVQIYDYARQLLEAHGDKAVAEAAQKAVAFEQQGEREQAATWRHIEAALKTMRGPHVS
jgi:hypothetical protein